MKEEALKLADEIDNFYKHHNEPYFLIQLQSMIRRLVEELGCANDYIKQYQLEIKNHKYDPETGEPLIDGYPLFSGLPRGKPLDKEELYYLHESYYGMDDTGQWNLDYVGFARAIEERHGIK